MNRDIALMAENETVNKFSGNQTIEFWKAIGYLSTWAPTLYTRVSIRTSGGDGDLEAYYTEPGGRRYVIGAMWSKEERKYHFHS